jgi:hypothetical protein
VKEKREVSANAMFSATLVLNIMLVLCIEKREKRREERREKRR